MTLPYILFLWDLSDETRQSYGIQVFNQSLHDELLYNWTRPNGCKEQVAACQDSLKQLGLLFVEHETQDLGDICGKMNPECKATRPFQIYHDEVEPGAGW